MSIHGGSRHGSRAGREQPPGPRKTFRREQPSSKQEVIDSLPGDTPAPSAPPSTPPVTPPTSTTSPAQQSSPDAKSTDVAPERPTFARPGTGQTFRRGVRLGAFNPRQRSRQKTAAASEALGATPKVTTVASGEFNPKKFEDEQILLGK